MPIQGWNALVRVGRPALMVLAALGLPVTAGEDLLLHPERWETRFLEAVHRFPEVQPAVSFLQGTHLPLKDSERLALASSFLTKLAPFSLDPVLRDMFATTEATIDLRDIVEGGKTLLLDFRNETNRDRRRFKTRWVYEWFLSYVRYRGAGRHQPIQFVIDELTELTNQKSDGDDLFTRDLDELVNVTARNCSIQLLLCTQGLHQLSPTSQKTLLGMGNVMLGVTSDMEAAKLLAEQFLTLDPERVKRYENVWGGGSFGPFILDQRIVDMPIEEQILLGAQKLMRLKPFQFFMRVKGTHVVQRISTQRLMGRGWASDHPELLAFIRYKLSQRVGVPRIPATASHTPSLSSDTLKGNTNVTSQPARQSREHTEDDWSTPHRT